MAETPSIQYLNQIQSPSDFKEIPVDELHLVAEEIRK